MRLSFAMRPLYYTSGRTNKVVLVEAESVTHTLVYTYNGDGVRVASAADGIETWYVQDMVGLPQVLVETAGGQTTLYLYGVSRLAQVQGSDAEWFLGDALGSVRQLVDDDGAVVLARDYDPYGQMVSADGTGSSGYGFTGEQYDHYIDMLFLRARWYSVQTGRFSSQDPWEGDTYQPPTLHKYLYVLNDPINAVDPSGLIEEGEAEDAREVIQRLRLYSVIIHEDFGWYLGPAPVPMEPDLGAYGPCTLWTAGNWGSVWELEQVEFGVKAMADQMSVGNPSVFARKVGRTVVSRKPAHPRGNIKGLTGWNITLYDSAFWEAPGQPWTDLEVRNTVVHEFAHAWDNHNLWRYSSLLMAVTKSRWIPGRGYVPGGTPSYQLGGPKPTSRWEDWADAVGDYMFYRPDFVVMDSRRKSFVYHALHTRNVEEFYITILLQLGIVQ